MTCIEEPEQNTTHRRRGGHNDALQRTLDCGSGSYQELLFAYFWKNRKQIRMHAKPRYYSYTNAIIYMTSSSKISSKLIICQLYKLVHIKND